MSLKVTILDGKTTKTQTAFENLADYEVKAKLLAEVIRSELMNLRSGNAHTKTRAEVRGGGKKPWRQKGTGRARHGSIRSPLWVGGGVTFGPRNSVNWGLKINKTARLAALKSILKDRLEANSVYQFAESLTFPKTKVACEVLDNISNKSGIKTTQTLVLYTTEEKSAVQGFLSTDAKMMNARNLKISGLANHKNLLLTPNAKKVLEERVSQ